MDKQKKLRKQVIDEGRCMVRVKYLASGDLSTAAMCPGCWNSPERRKNLIQKMEQMGVQPTHSKDQLSGHYEKNQSHSPGCPYGRHNS